MFDRYSAIEKNRIAQGFRHHPSLVAGWMETLLEQGGDDPKKVLIARLEEVILRADLWSDQMIALRTIQSLTMLDVHHYCEIIWKLGGYDQNEEAPRSLLPMREQARPPSMAISISSAGNRPNWREAAPRSSSETT